MDSSTFTLPLLIILGISLVSLAISIYLALKMKKVSYLLEQPVVKKMSPQLKLKPIKLDELMAERNRQQQQGRDGRPGNPNPRHGSPRGEPGSSERRPDQNREPRQDRRPERSEGDRNRGSGDRFRDRGDRGGNRGENRGERGDRGDRRPREFSENREGNRDNREPVREPVVTSAPQPQMESPRFETSAPAPHVHHEAPLSPRRPLSVTVEPQSHVESNTASSQESEGSAGFGDGDVQHGRRTQLKKKPRFEFDESEVKTEG